ncbi:MAG: hypothetical protein ACRD8W_26025, partial [Nitrososphaeraceae archaeon]
ETIQEFLLFINVAAKDPVNLLTSEDRRSLPYWPLIPEMDTFMVELYLSTIYSCSSDQFVIVYRGEGLN